MQVSNWRSLTIALFTGAIACVLTTVLPARAHAAIEDVTVDKMEFEGDPTDPSAGARLTRCRSGVDDDLVIPAQVTIGGVTMDVVSVGAFACDRSKVGGPVETIVIPDTVTYIGAFAFDGLGATSLELGVGIKTIDAHAFAYNNLTGLTLPHGLETIEAGAFYDNRLTSVTLPESLTTLGGRAFQGNDLTYVEVPSSISVLTRDVFSGNRLTSFTWNASSPMTIGPAAFWWNEFTTVLIPDGVTVIDEGAFIYNPVVSVYVPASVTKIGEDAFEHRFNQATLKTVTFAGNAPTLESGWADIDGVTVYYPKGATGFESSSWPRAILIEYVTVTFDTGAVGTPIAPADVLPGEAVTRPTDPERPGYNFVGWFDAPTDGDPFDFTSVNDHTTAYAQWADIPESVTAPTGATQGESITLAGNGFQPNEPLEVWLLSTPVQLTTLTADAQGAFTTTVTIPANVTPGAHTLEIRGAQSPTFAQSFTVFAALPATGPDPSVGPIAVTALLLAGAGVALVLINRRRNAPRK